MSSDKTPRRLTNSEPPEQMSERTLRKTLESIESSIQEQKGIEAQRAGVAKFRSRLLTVFGGLITAAAVGGFAWVWDAQTSNALQDAAISQIKITAEAHDPAPAGHGGIESSLHAMERRIDGAERSAENTASRLERMDRDLASRHQTVLSELRRIRNSQRTWGE